MKKTKLLAIVLSAIMIVALFAACGGTPTPSATPAPAESTPAPVESTPEPAADPAPSGVTEITLYNNKVEIDEALKQYAATYEAQTGIKVNIRSAGGDTSYSVALKADLQGGVEPEIFVLEGPSGFNDYNERLTDLSDQPWVSDTDLAYTHNGTLVGFPVAIEGYGLGYNKAMLEKAGVNPAQLTTFAAVKEAFEIIDSKKSELGIDAVLSMAAGPGMTWVTGLHSWNTYLTNGLKYDDFSVADKMMNGEVDEARLKEYAAYVELMFKYTDKRILLTGTYDDQINAFAMQKAAFVHQGNWADPSFQGAGMNFEAGYAPHPFLSTETDGIFVAAPSWYVVNNKAPGVEEAKKFLAAMASSPEGHDYMVNIAGMVPAFKSVTLKPAGAFSSAVMDWATSGKIYNWQQYRMPDGFGMDTLGPIYSQFAAGDINLDEFCNRITAAVATLK